MKTRNQILIPTVLLALLLQKPCLADSFYFSKEEMILRAEAIAVVAITNVETLHRDVPTGTGGVASFEQRAMGRVEQVIKGDISGEIKLYGMENGLCNETSFQQGHFLVFLSRGGRTFWQAVNFNIGVRPITNERVAWFLPNKRYLSKDEFEATEQPVVEVVAEIEKVLKQPAPNNASQDTSLRADPER